MKKKRIGRKFMTKAAIMAALLFAIGGTTLSYALIDETNSVHIDASGIEDATLIIGTHLIYLGSMNDQIYAEAVKSAEESNQYNRYYKSEIAGGVWYEITEAGTLADITTDGIVVEDKVIEALFMTHHTKSDGITYDLRTGAAVGVFDINNPYDLSNMTELEPIKMQYDVLVQTEDPSDTMERDILYIKEIYQFNRQTDKTREIDAQLNALQAYYNILVADGAEEAMSDMVMSVMEKIDAARRVEVLGPLNDTQLQKMSQVVGREYIYLAGEITGTVSASQEIEQRVQAAIKAAKEEVYEEYGIGPDATQEELDAINGIVMDAAQKASEEAVNAGRAVVENFVPNSDLLSAIGESMTNVQESYTNYSSKMLAEGTTILSRAEYQFSMELISHAQGGNYSGCDEAVNKLIYLDRINNNVIREENQEREFIEQELLGKAKENYRSSLGNGVGESYQTLSSTAAASTKANVLKNQLSETEIVRNELQFIMQAYIDRMAPESGMDYVTECIDGIEDYHSIVKTDAFETYAATSIDSHLEWLTKTLKKLQDLMGGSALDDLNLQKNDLQTELMTALDHNKLDQAKKIETQIEAIDMEIDETEKYLNSVLNSEYASDSEKALAAAQLGDGNTLAALQEIKEDAIENIKNGNLDDIKNALEGIDALASTQPEGAMSALKDIYGELSNQELMGEDSSQLDDLMGQVEDLAMSQVGKVSNELTEDILAALIQNFVKENMNGNPEEDFAPSGNSSSKIGDIGNMTEEDSSGQPADATGNNTQGLQSLDEVMESLNEEQMTTMLAGLSAYSEQTNDGNVKEVLKTYSKKAYNDSNEYVYEQFKNELSEFVPTDRLARILNYRYIFNDSQKLVTLQRGSQYYQFEAFSSTVKKGKDIEEMNKASGFQKVIYIPGEMVQEYFTLDTVYLENTSYGVIMTKEMNELATEFFDYLLEAEGDF